MSFLIELRQQKFQIKNGSGIAEWAVNVMQGGQDVDFTGGEIEDHIKAIENYVILQTMLANGI